MIFSGRGYRILARRGAGVFPLLLNVIIPTFPLSLRPPWGELLAIFIFPIA